MSKGLVVAAIELGEPFSLRMADGREFHIPHRDYISLSPKGTFATVYDDEEKFYVLPLLTMTGIASCDAERPSGS
jgi:hypothetical protein